MNLRLGGSNAEALKISQSFVLESYGHREILRPGALFPVLLASGDVLPSPREEAQGIRSYLERSVNEKLGKAMSSELLARHKSQAKLNQSLAQSALQIRDRLDAFGSQI